MKYIYLLLGIFFVGCGFTSSQFTFYKHHEEEPAWRITVEQSMFKDKFDCKIDDKVIMSESFGIFSKSFETHKIFHGKDILMAGYKEDHKHYTKYYIRVFVDEREISGFVF
jgi:hypothetical protein